MTRKQLMDAKAERAAQKAAEAARVEEERQIEMGRLQDELSAMQEAEQAAAQERAAAERRKRAATKRIQEINAQLLRMMMK